MTSSNESRRATSGGGGVWRALDFMGVWIIASNARLHLLRVSSSRLLDIAAAAVHCSTHRDINLDATVVVVAVVVDSCATAVDHTRLRLVVYEPQQKIS